MKKVILLTAFVTGFSLLSLAGTGGAGTETGTVQGTIIDSETKKPVANTSFSAAINKASFQKEFQTDANGNFKINIPVGEHTLVIDKMGYKAVKRENIIIREGVMIKISFEVVEAEEELHHPFLTPITIHTF
jgi:CarboxypepD_reg-like domain